MTKSTNAELMLRAIELAKRTIRGYTYNDNVKYCKENYYVTSSRTIAKYMAAAKLYISENNKDEVNEIRALENTRYSEMIKEVEQRLSILRQKAELSPDKNYETEILRAIELKKKITERIDKINGLEVTKVEHSGSISNPVVLPEEVETRLIEALKHYEK